MLAFAIAAEPIPPPRQTSGGSLAFVVGLVVRKSNRRFRVSPSLDARAKLLAELLHKGWRQRSSRCMAVLCSATVFAITFSEDI